LASSAAFVIRPTYVAALTILSRNQVRSAGSFCRTVRSFHRGVFEALQEHPFRGLVSSLAPIKQSNMKRKYRAGKSLRLRVPSRKKTAMGLTKDIKTMNDLFIHQLQEIYYAEKQLVKTRPRMAEKATDKLLKDSF
jgi:hypothetical protein